MASSIVGWPTTNSLPTTIRVADIAIWPWVSRFDWQTIDLNQFPNVKRWYVTIANRPAVRKGYDVPKKVQEIPMP